jgi:uncharacterized membrane protein (UPF0127 family)
VNVFILRNASTGAAIAAVARAQNYWERLAGLLRSSNVALSDGIWLEPCSAIHTIGMRARIDIIFLDRHGTVLRTHDDVPPNRLAVFCPRAHITVELGAGTLARSTVRLGDRLHLEEAAVPA